MDYIGISLKELIQVDTLYRIHRFKYSQDFLFAGESNDFWEFIYAEKGNVNICTNDTSITLQKGEIAFYQPMEHHRITLEEFAVPNLVVIAFQSNSAAMSFFQKKVFKIDERERSILSELLLEAKNMFLTPLDNPCIKEIEKQKDLPFGTEQLIKIHLQHLLLHLMRRYYHVSSTMTTTPYKNSTEIFKRVTDYMERNLNLHLTVEQICHENMVGRTQLQKIFQKESGYSIIEYFSKLKIETAKPLIRNGNMNFTQISEQLGYTSIHYFSRQFKKISGMTPSEYALSMKTADPKNNS